ncbi:MAG TPA: hypothetical protein GXZ89_04900 [Fastidiosipila sp.]|nr:hypothetical protein [Fastidiosipila sp.]
MNKQDDAGYISVRSLRVYTAPCFRWLFYLTIALIVIMLGGALYYLYGGFIRPLPADATAAHGWGQLYFMLFGLLLLFMTLIQIVVLLVLLRYRRFVYSSLISHVPLLVAGSVAFLYAAVLFALAFTFFEFTFVVLLPALIFLLLGLGWFVCYTRCVKLRADEEDEDLGVDLESDDEDKNGEINEKAIPEGEEAGDSRREVAHDEEIIVQ